MRRHWLPVFLLSVLLPLIVSRSREASAAGEERWTRVVSIGTPGQALVALGEPFDVSVADELVGETTCNETGCGGSSCSTPRKSNPHTIESLTCDGPASCSVTARPGPTPGTSTIAVEAEAEGRATISLRLRDRRGDVRSATFDINFARPTKIGVARDLAAYPHGSTYAALPGAAYSWCARVEHNGAPLLFNHDRIAVSVRGDGVTGMTAGGASIFPYPVCRRCSVTEPATIHVSFHYGALARNEVIRVVGADEVVGLELVEVPAQHGEMPIERDPFANAPVVEAVYEDACRSGAQPLYIPRARTKFGAIALGAEVIRAEPAELVHAAGAGMGGRGTPAGVFGLSGRLRGTGTLHVVAGNADLGIPLTVHGNCSPSPGFDPHKTADGGAADDAGIPDGGEQKSGEPAADAAP
jgi:hypothetical protein